MYRKLHFSKHKQVHREPSVTTRALIVSRSPDLKAFAPLATDFVRLIKFSFIYSIFRFVGSLEVESYKTQVVQH